MSDTRQLVAAFNEAQAQIAAEAEQAVSERMLKVCFERCVSKPDERLTDRQRRCLDQCTGAFRDGLGVASEVMSAILKKQGAGHE
jgi:hypothetical protein